MNVRRTKLLKQSEVDFIINKLDKGKEYIEKKDWRSITEDLDGLELEIGYADSNFDRINDIGRYIEHLIDKIVDDEGNDDVLEIEAE